MSFEHRFLAAYREEVQHFLQEYQHSENPRDPNEVLWSTRTGIENMLETRMKSRFSTEEMKLADSLYQEKWELCRSIEDELKAHFDHLVATAHTCLPHVEGEVQVIRLENFTRQETWNHPVREVTYPEVIEVGALRILFDGTRSKLKRYAIEDRKNRLLFDLYLPGYSKQERAASETRLIQLLQDLHAAVDFGQWDTMPLYMQRAAIEQVNALRQAFEA